MCNHSNATTPLPDKGPLCTTESTYIHKREDQILKQCPPQHTNQLWGSKMAARSELSLLTFLLFALLHSYSPYSQVLAQPPNRDEAGTPTTSTTSSSSSSCSMSEPLGFTALSPRQLREEISTTVSSSMAGSLQLFTQRMEQNEQLMSHFVGRLEEVLDEFNATLLQSQTRLVHLLQAMEDEGISSTANLERLAQNFSSILNTALSSIQTPTTQAPPPPILAVSLTTNPPTSPPPLPSSPPPTLPILGSYRISPALSCNQILELYPDSSSGYYYLATVVPRNGEETGLVPQVTKVYCSMKETCGGKGSGGWIRVAHIDMTNVTHTCPTGGTFTEWTRDSPPRRLCIPRSPNSGCFSHKFPLPALSSSATQICGRITAYQNATTNGFFPFHLNNLRTIDEVYVDGISLTHGVSSRTHIWTLVSALDETAGHLSACACSNSEQLATSDIPSFVGNRYFCDTATRDAASFRFYPGDPLWDGKGCGAQSSCCSFNSPPWFTANLGDSPAGDAIEMRVCRDSGGANENIPFELVELYIK